MSIGAGIAHTGNAGPTCDSSLLVGFGGKLHRSKVGMDSPSLVHTSETTQRMALTGSLPAKFGHLQKAKQASAIELYEHLEADPEGDYFQGEDDLEITRSQKLRHCRKTGYYGRHKETGLVRPCRDSCKLRWCALCGSALVSWRTYVVSEWLTKCYRPRFATFTIEHSDEELTFQLLNLNRYWTNLRRYKNFREHVRGGIWFPHVKRSSQDGCWHPHVHTVLEGSYYPQAELSSDWNRTTRGSRVVDIRKIIRPDKAANEVARYSANPCDLSKLSLEDCVTVYHALHGRRGCGTWGTAKGVPLKLPESDGRNVIENVGSISAVNELRNSDLNARAIYEAAVNHTYLEPGIHLVFTDDVTEVDGFYRREIVSTELRGPAA